MLKKKTRCLFLADQILEILCKQAAFSFTVLCIIMFFSYHPPIPSSLPTWPSWPVAGHVTIPRIYLPHLTQPDQRIARYADSPSTCADKLNWTSEKPSSSTKSLHPSTTHETSPYTIRTRSHGTPTPKQWTQSKKPSDTECSSTSPPSILTPSNRAPTDTPEPNIRWCGHGEHWQFSKIVNIRSL